MDGRTKMARARAARRPRRPKTAPVLPETALTAQQRRFVQEYVVDHNGAEAARKAGYAPKNAHVQASQLLTRVNIRAAVDQAEAEWAARAEISLKRVARDIATAANLDPLEAFDSRGNVLPLNRMPPHIRRAIVSIEVVKRNVTAGDRAVDQVLKIRLIDKARMHELLALATAFVKGEGVTATQGPAFVFTDDTKGVSVH